MTADEIFSRVQRVISRKLGISENIVKAESRFEQDLAADSLDMVEIVIAVEDEFTELGLEVEDSEMDKWKTVQDVVNLVVSAAA
jgi:acyl carrier protein